MLPAVNNAAPRQRLAAARFVQSVVMWCWLLVLTLMSISSEPAVNAANALFLVAAAFLASVALWLFFYQRKMIRRIKAEQ